MKTDDSQLQQMFVRATDEVIPPAPWLEAQVVEALQRRRRVRRRVIDLGAIGGFGSGLRLTAGMAALLIAVGTVAALLMSARILHNPTVPGGSSTTPLPILTVPFTPSPAVRASNWPPGGPVPAQLAGAWQQAPSAQILHLGLYTFQVGDEHPDDATNGGNIGPPLFGNVVVNGSEIDFMSDICTLNGDFGFERFTYTVNGNTLVITRTPGPGQSNCWAPSSPSLWPSLAATYSRIGTAGS